jgi:hypothetical protein
MDKVIVSNKFIEIYKNFNVVSQIKQMEELSREELLLLLIITFRTYEFTDLVTKTYKYFEDELLYIDSCLFDYKLKDPDKLKMREVISDRYLDSEKIFDEQDNPLPPPTTEEDAKNIRRLLKLNNILNS